MERKRASKLAAGVGSSALAALAVIACGGESKQNRSPIQDGPTAVSRELTPSPSITEIKVRPQAATLGEEFPNLKLKKIDGSEFDVDSFRGRTVVLYHYVSKFLYDEQVVRQLADLQSQQSDKIQVLGVALGRENTGGIEGKIPVGIIDAETEKRVFGGTNSGVYIVEANGKLDYKLDDPKIDQTVLASNINDALQKDGQEVISQKPTAEPTQNGNHVESENSPEAVLDVGKFDIAVTGWEEFNVEPKQTRVFNGKAGDAGTVVDIKHVVVKAIIRNKTNEGQDLSELIPEHIGLSNAEFVDSSGKSTNFSLNAIIPIEYEGIFGEPFEPFQDGTLRNITELYQPNKFHPVTYMEPGFGLPVFFVGEIPVDMKDYGIYFYDQPRGGKNEKRIFKKGQIAKDFSLIAPDAQISDVSVSLIANGLGGGTFEAKFLGSTEARSADKIAHKVLLFDFKNNTNFSFDIFGRVYLKDGRVLQIEDVKQILAPGYKGTNGLYAGTSTARADFPMSQIASLNSDFDFDLSGSVVILKIFGGWKAWRMPDLANLPVAQGGE